MLSGTGFLLLCMSENIEKVALSIPENILGIMATVLPTFGSCFMGQIPFLSPNHLEAL